MRYRVSDKMRGGMLCVDDSVCCRCLNLEDGAAAPSSPISIPFILSLS